MKLLVFFIVCVGIVFYSAKWIAIGIGAFLFWIGPSADPTGLDPLRWVLTATGIVILALVILRRAGKNSRDLPHQ